MKIILTFLVLSLSASVYARACTSQTFAVADSSSNVIKHGSHYSCDGEAVISLTSNSNILISHSQTVQKVLSDEGVKLVNCEHQIIPPSFINSNTTEAFSCFYTI